jgi:membrane fusion protein, multidrug efflux system
MLASPPFTGTIAIRLSLGMLLLIATLSGCSTSNAEDKAGGKRPTPTVGFVVAQVSTVPLQTSLGGRTVAFEASEVRPQINGLIRRRYFTEGSLVHQGQPLFQIDPAMYQAQANQASANLASARASAEAASAKAARYAPLAKMEAVAEQDYADVLAQSRQARASVAQNNAALEIARINLRYTTVPAPITGRIGRSFFTTGALVNANQTDPLAVIQRLDPIYVDMQQSSGELLALRRALGTGDNAAGSADVRLTLEDGSDYPLAGRIEFSEMTVNEATGTVTLRARFPNPQGMLLPGMFVQAAFNQAFDNNAILIPQMALQRDFGGIAFVYLVGPGNKVVRRNVTAARAVGPSWVVTAGLKAGDKVITQGLNNLKQGAPIRPVPANTPQSTKSRPASG